MFIAILALGNMLIIFTRVTSIRDAEWCSETLHTNPASFASGCFPGRCVSSSSWRFLSTASKTTFPPARRGQTWPRSWKNTPRPATTTPATTASTAAMEREARQPSPTTGETPPQRDTMVRKKLNAQQQAETIKLTVRLCDCHLSFIYIIYLSLFKGGVVFLFTDISASFFGFLVQRNMSQWVAATQMLHLQYNTGI